MDAHFEDTDAAFLQRVARLLLASGDGRVALLTAASEGGAFFSLCASAEAAGDLRETGRRVAAILDGRGGGTPDLVQGKAGSLTRRDEVIAFLAELPPPAS
jgi:alanyl-tRNA synthetase